VQNPILKKGGKTMIRLVYVSSATKEMHQEELLELLKQSREKNKEKNLTGMLLYANGNFFQVLEGEQSDVIALYNKIIKDERHRNCFEIDQSEIEERTFGEWSMGFKYLTLEDKKSLEGFSEFLDKKMQPHEFAANPSEVVELLYNFKQNI
jgi:hypothetical protein